MDCTVNDREFFKVDAPAGGVQSLSEVLAWSAIDRRVTLAGGRERLTTVANEALLERLASGLPDAAPPATAFGASVGQGRGAEAPRPSITGALNSQEVGGKGRETGGVDWLSIAVYGDWDTQKYWQLRRVLEAGKVKAQEAGENAVMDLPEGGQAVVRPSGVRHGPIFAEWVIECGGVKLHLSKRQFEHATMPSLFVELGSVALMQYGHVALWEDVQRLLGELGFSRTRDVPSRVDICVDRPGVSMTEYACLYDHERYVCRACTDQKWRDRKKVTGLGFGKGIHCRIYDKLKEVESQPEKYAVLLERRYGGVRPASAVRVEFQLRRDEMKDQFDVKDTADLFAKLGSIAKFLTEDWLRFTEKTVDRKNNHQGLAGVAAEWEAVKADFAEAFSGSDLAAEKRAVQAPRPKALVKQAWGCLLAAMAAEGNLTMDYGEFLASLEDRLTEAAPQEWHVQLRLKAAEFAAQFPGVVCGPGPCSPPPPF